MASALIEAALDTGLPPREARATVASAARSAARHLQPPTEEPQAEEPPDACT
ncbi:hypothetical protein [Streptomyces sp. GMR22]|uniref:hypothetical protein n=1 Tax=Streptomyces sp. GMR22 TaxID=2759524 RepID=UPI001F29D031|nr:hypothetical protein [Streptomyces sp. GMR22]